jgi:hypothetical protein
MDSRIRISIEGAEGVRSLLREADKASKRAARTALEQVGDKALAIARPITPIDDEEGGQLRESLRRTKPTIKKSGDVVVTLIAGGRFADTDSYAVIQHESMEFKHTDPGTGPKFLERGALAAAPELIPALEQALAKELPK